MKHKEWIALVVERRIGDANIDKSQTSLNIASGNEAGFLLFWKIIIISAQVIISIENKRL